VSRRPSQAWSRWAAPTAFLAAATVAIVLVASALHGTSDERPAPGVTVPATSAARTTTRARTRTTARGTFYTVVAGDTFGTIAAKTGTTVARLEQLNPTVSSTSLHIGQKLRVA
jgi:LysM repeat protein